MAYDRYVAVCQPLHYHSKMTSNMISKLVAFAWIFPIFTVGACVYLAGRLRLCGNKIPKVFCANWPVVKLSCISTVLNNLVGMLMTTTTVILPLAFVLYIYMHFSYLLEKLFSKVIQSCMPHIVTFVNFSISLFCDIALSRIDVEIINQFLGVFLSLEFVLIPPILNPFVYGLKLPEIRKCLSRLYFTFEERMTLFCLTLLWYLMIIFGNVALIVAIIMDKNLHEPMYIFVCNLCISALYGTVGFYPKFLLDLLSSHVISYAGCMLQGYVIHSSSCCDFSILALMAYDRYVAICRPLVYHSVMTRQRVSLFVVLSWFVPLFLMFMNSASLLGIRLCGSHIKRIYCVNWMIVTLACSPPKANSAIAYFNILFYFAHFVFIVWSYMYLIRTCVSSRKWGKFIQTCLPHLISLIIFSIAVLLDVMYMRFGKVEFSQNFYNFMAIQFLLVPPFVNPFIYGFHLTKVRNKILKMGVDNTGEGTTLFNHD
ncbi:hypothetical protein F7725_001740 [Dissostichus mawsoni]|uniref:G-protein coupled receptors family 1 profile domain-containing protein n=1 Tax=Dissostichus mawsoni TaxID=36200 RepID=A0A7J5Y1D6_DISMA|nr:hypothetical protein F7725_001740 [Dissostichus mawsoni]